MNESPSSWLRLSMSIYSVQGEYVDAPMLENHYKGSKYCEKMDEIASSVGFVSDSLGSETINPVASNSRSQNESSDTSTIASRVHTMSVGRPSLAGDDSVRPASKSNQQCNRTVLQCWAPMASVVTSLLNMSPIMQFVRMKILLVRAFFILFKRFKMVIGTTIMHILMAVLFCVIVGETGPDLSVVTPVAAFGGLLLIMSGVQYVFFLFNNNKVLC
jgi:hypothetical protein